MSTVYVVSSMMSKTASTRIKYRISFHTAPVTCLFTTDSVPNLLLLQVWNQFQHNALYFPPGNYLVLFSKTGFVDKLVLPLNVTRTSQTMKVTVAHMPSDPLEVIVLLTWAETPKDMDL